jgi:hypothetical protein
MRLPHQLLIQLIPHLPILRPSILHSRRRNGDQLRAGPFVCENSLVVVGGRHGAQALEDFQGLFDMFARHGGCEEELVHGRMDGDRLRIGVVFGLSVVTMLWVNCVVHSCDLVVTKRVYLRKISKIFKMSKTAKNHTGT